MSCINYYYYKLLLRVWTSFRKTCLRDGGGSTRLIRQTTRDRRNNRDDDDDDGDDDNNNNNNNIRNFVDGGVSVNHDVYIIYYIYVCMYISGGGCSGNGKGGKELLIRVDVTLLSRTYKTRTRRRKRAKGPKNKQLLFGEHFQPPRYRCRHRPNTRTPEAIHFFFILQRRKTFYSVRVDVSRK